MRILNLTLQTVFKTHVYDNSTHQFLDHYESRLEVEVGGKVFWSITRNPSHRTPTEDGRKALRTLHKKEIIGLIKEHLYSTKTISFVQWASHVEGIATLDGWQFSSEISTHTPDALPEKEVYRRVVSGIMHKIEQKLFEGWEI